MMRPMANGTVPPARRVSAVLALAGVVIAALAFLWLVVEAEPGSLLVIVVAQSLALGAAFIAVSRSGFRRWLAVAVIVAGWVITFLVIEGNGQVLKLVAFIALWPIIGALARFALAVDPRSLAAQTIAGTDVGPLTNVTIIMNPWSGGGKVGRFDLEREARERGITPVVLQQGDDIVQLALDAVASGADGLGAAGGDGTQALVADIAATHNLPFVCIPAGTRNHFALDLGLDREDVVGALDAVGDAVERRVDLAEVNGRTFVNNCSLGVYARIVQSDDYRDAKAKTAARMLPDMLGPDGDLPDLEFTDGKGRARRSTQMLLVSNNPYALDRVGGFGTRVSMDTGRLGMVDVQVESPSELRTLVALQAADRVQQFSGWAEWTDTEFTLHSHDHVEIGVDGEALKLEPPLVFAIRPGALRVRLPHHAPGRAPAAVAVNLDVSTARALAHVAAGHPANEPDAAPQP
jgi:diacylglycerol kinase family enzyme